jgi:hypothetical protein
MSTEDILKRRAAMGETALKRAALEPHLSKFRADVRGLVAENLANRLTVGDDDKVADVSDAVAAYLREYPGLGADYGKGGAPGPASAAPTAQPKRWDEQLGEDLDKAAAALEGTS